MRLAVLVSALLCALLAAPCRTAAQAAPVRDDFAAHPEGSDGAPAWEPDGFSWEVRGGRYRSDWAGRAFAYHSRVAHGRRLVVEATIVLERPATDQWKVAGLAVVADERNFWHLAFVEQPDAQGGGRLVELSQMLEGRWMAQGEGETALRVAHAAGGDFAWSYGRPYRMRIALSPEGIEGTVREMDGTERVRIGFAFTAKAVTAGRPALTTAGLAAAFDDFEASIAEEAPAPVTPAPPPYTGLGRGPFRSKATGFFRVERVDGRWWLIDPVGEAFFAVGTDHVSYHVHWAEKLGYAPYARNVAAKYGSEERWAASAARRLRAWGFNLLGAGAGRSVRHRGLAHTDFLSVGADFTAISYIAERTTWTGFPDVFHPKWPAWCDWVARRICAPQRNDPWLLGIFLDNELEWFGKNGRETGLVDEVLKRPADHPSRLALAAFLRERHATVDALRAAWGRPDATFESPAPPESPETPAATRDRRAFVRLIAERYFSVAVAAIRRHAPNHLILGCRFAGTAPDVWAEAGRHLDIVSVNFYGRVDLERGITTDMPRALADYYRRSGRPLMITEWSFPALDAGLPSLHGAGQRVLTQRDRARAYSIYKRRLFALPFMVGSNYFMWVDQPAEGISSTFPEDSNYGLVDVNDRPWPELTAMAARINPMARDIHASRAPEVSVQVRPAAAGATVILRNRGRAPARFALRLRVQGRLSERAVSLPAGSTLSIPVRAAGVALVTAEVDPQDRLVEADRSDNAARATVGVRAGMRGLVVANGAERALRNVPLEAWLTGAPPRWRALTDGRRAVAIEFEQVEGGHVLVGTLRELPALTAIHLRPVAGEPRLVRQERHESLVLGGREAGGGLELTIRSGSPNVVERVTLGGVPIGRYTVLVHQTDRQPLWVHPDRVEIRRVWRGRVRTAVEVVAIRGADGAAITAAGPGGDYAAQTTVPGQYAATVRVEHWLGEDWFGARFRSIRNTDRRSWTCRQYYHYPLSSIGGRTEDDISARGTDAPMWIDEAAGLAYGALVDLNRMRALFWKDTPDSPRQHADISRDVDRTLAPGQTLAFPADEPEVRVFAGRTEPVEPGGATLRRLRDLARVQVALRR
ncbi:MAG TPA: hypothetical protein VLH79_15665 [Chthonomonadales bacterium]|nr:hypothetical protein [Chthonomonadales bacterium]